VFDAATNSGDNTYAIEDTAAAVQAASVSVLEGSTGHAIEVTDASVTAATATALRALDAANNDDGNTAAVEGFTIDGGVTAGVFTISDTFENLTATANAAAVTASTSVTASGTITVAQAVSLEDAAAAALGATALTYAVSDTYTNLVLNASSADALAVTDFDVTVSNTMNVAQAKVVDGYTSGAMTHTIADSAANVATNVANAVVTGATTVTLSGVASVANAAIVAELPNLSGYDISDRASNVQAALDTVNAASAGDRALIEGATAITLTTAASVTEATGGASGLGLYTVSGLSYTIGDAAGATVATALEGNDAAAITSATSIAASTASMTVAQATVVTALVNFAGYDDAGTADVVETNYYIEDGFVAIQAADTALIGGAKTVTANGTADGSATVDILNMSMHSNGMAINGNDGADVITGTAGADTFVGDATAVDSITDFVGGSDYIYFTDAATFEDLGLGAMAGADLATAVTNAFGAAAGVNDAGIEALQFTYGGDTYFAIEAGAADNDTDAAVIKVTGLSGTVIADDFI